MKNIPHEDARKERYSLADKDRLSGASAILRLARLNPSFTSSAMLAAEAEREHDTMYDRGRS